MALQGESYSITRDALFAQQQEIPAVTDKLTIASGEGELKRGCLIDEDGKACASSGSDGSKTYAEPYAVLAEDVDATSAAVEAPVYLTGEFNIKALSAKTGEDVANYKKAARKVGIFMKEIME